MCQPFFLSAYPTPPPTTLSRAGMWAGPNPLLPTPSWTIRHAYSQCLHCWRCDEPNPDRFASLHLSGWVVSRTKVPNLHYSLSLKSNQAVTLKLKWNVLPLITNFSSQCLLINIHQARSPNLFNYLPDIISIYHSYWILGHLSVPPSLTFDLAILCPEKRALSFSSVSVL